MYRTTDALDVQVCLIYQSTGIPLLLIVLIHSSSYHKLFALRSRLPEPGQPLAQLVLVAVGHSRADRVAGGSRQFHVKL